MENLQKLIEQLNINKIVMDDDYLIDKKYLNGVDVEILNDSRSAGFFAYGQSKISNSNIALIIDGQFITNVYTSLTEAWFQKTNLIVIALYNSIYDVNDRYLDRCSICNLTFFLRDLSKFEKNISNSLLVNGPKIFNVVVEHCLAKQVIDYSDILKKFSSIINKEDQIYLFNADLQNYMYNDSCHITNIEYKYKYGVLSKYSAYLFGNNNNILICSSECLKLDSNILNSRYLKSNFKVIVIDGKNIKSMAKWCEKNSIEFFSGKCSSENLEKVYNSKKAIVFAIGEGI